MKCLEKERSRRYATADALARDVEAYLEDRPVSASPPSVRYRLRKWNSVVSVECKSNGKSPGPNGVGSNGKNGCKHYE